MDERNLADISTTALLDALERSVDRIADVGQMRARIAELEAQLGKALAVVNTLKQVMPDLEKMEEQLLVGDEGCIWAIELLRADLAALEQENG